MKMAELIPLKVCLLTSGVTPFSAGAIFFYEIDISKVIKFSSSEKDEEICKCKYLLRLFNDQKAEDKIFNKQCSSTPSHIQNSKTKRQTFRSR